MALQVDLKFVSQQKETLNSVRPILRIPGSKLIATYIGGASGTSELIWRNLRLEACRQGQVSTSLGQTSVASWDPFYNFFFRTNYGGLVGTWYYPSMTRIRGK